jgi:anaerobic selenocysteine-containing dehydrogenase
MNPTDAAALGVVDGDTIRVITEGGRLETTVELTDTLQRGNVTLPNGMGTDYPENGDRAPTGVAPNELTITGGRSEDPFAGTPFHKHVPARLEVVW